MFDTILIANRGEIACRVIDTARAMGLRTVAVHSAVDAGARHVALADHAVNLGGARSDESYLRGDAIIAAAQATGAQAIHPGYGFLSENPDFVDAVTAAGLVFIGPSAKAIRAMGLKDAAKKLMQEAGVPVVPGYLGADQNPETLANEAAAIGYPVLIKAVAGGGGKGMRLVERAADFDAALQSAKAEARGAFGNDAVLIEKFVTKPRHIEVQVFGDGQRAVHLFERDCSLQRRHQKVIEEAPAPDMPAGVRAAMGAAAVRAAEAIGYAGAGTVEFIVDGSGPLREDGFWFMEMNTRLQVEHPVTEAITGVDLVAWQIRVAAGAPLPCGQDDLLMSGHAMEARLYAEDVAAGFLPATGRLTHLVFPDNARADTGVRPGDTISPHYDPMIAKIIVHGPTRAIARRKLEDALARTEVAGTTTNLSFLTRLVAHPDFASGQVDTGLIDRSIADLRDDPPAHARTIAQAFLTAASARDDPFRGFALWQSQPQQITLGQAETRLTGTITWHGANRATIHTGDTTVTAETRQGRWWFDDQPAASVCVADGTVTVFANPSVRFDVIDPLDQAQDQLGGDALALAPMPGRIVRVAVAAGATVSAGDTLIVLEAMKMEHALRAPRDGTVIAVFADEGAQVEAGAPLVELEPEGDDND